MNAYAVGREYTFCGNKIMHSLYPFNAIHPQLSSFLQLVVSQFHCIIPRNPDLGSYLDQFNKILKVDRNFTDNLFYNRLKCISLRVLICIISYKLIKQWSSFLIFRKLNIDEGRYIDISSAIIINIRENIYFIFIHVIEILNEIIFPDTQTHTYIYI